MYMKTKKDSVKEPSVVIRPLGAMGGLDNIHLGLVVLVVVLVALLLAVARSKPVPVVANYTSSNSAQNCTYGIIGGKCVLPENNVSQITRVAERFLASYNYINTSLSLLPYISNVSEMKMAYDASDAQWYVSMPAKNPGSNSSFTFAMMINDRNTSQVTPLIQTVRPGMLGSDFVVSKGVVQIAGQPECAVSSPLQIYWFMDPYSPGAIASLSNLTSLRSRLGSRINASVKILYTQYSQAVASLHGLNQTLALGSYLFCASGQRSFEGFYTSIGAVYNGSYISPSQLGSLAQSSGLNMSGMEKCLGSAQAIVQRQGLLAHYYNITSSPAVVTDCRYLAIPQTELSAIRYANSSLV